MNSPVDVLVNGWPWRTVVASHLVITTTLPDGSPYRNEGMQLLRLRWGRVVEDLTGNARVEEVARRVAEAYPGVEVIRVRVLKPEVPIKGSILHGAAVAAYLLLRLLPRPRREPERVTQSVAHPRHDPRREP